MRKQRVLANVSCRTDLQAHKPEQLAMRLKVHILPFQTDRAKSARVANIMWLAGWCLLCFGVERQFNVDNGLAACERVSGFGDRGSCTVLLDDTSSGTGRPAGIVVGASRWWHRSCHLSISTAVITAMRVRSLLRRISDPCANWNRLKASSSLFCYILKPCISEKRFDCSVSLPEWQRSCCCVSSLLITMRDTRKVS